MNTTLTDARESTIRAFPVRVRPVTNESVTSYFRRLCDANLLDQKDAWLHLRHHDASLQFGVKPRSAKPHVARLGGLPADFFSSTGSDATCRHDPTYWVRTCDCCRTGSASTPACRRCADGVAAESYRAVGPVCIKHKRWHAGGLDMDVAQLESHLLAQRRLNRLRRHTRIGFRSSQATIARDLLFEWHTPRDRDNSELSPSEQLDSFPLLVELLVRLSSTVVTAILHDRKIPGETVSRILQLITCGVVHREPLTSSFASLMPGAYATTSVEVCTLVRTLREVRVPDVDPSTRYLMGRLRTVRAALLRHRDQRVNSGPAARRTGVPERAGEPSRRDEAA